VSGVLYGDQPGPTDQDRIKAEAEHLMRVGLSEVHAWGVAHQNSKRDAEADRFDRPDRDAKANRVESLQTAFAMAVRRGEAHTLKEKFEQIHEASIVEEELERRRVDHERRRVDVLPPGQLSGSTTPIPPIESRTSIETPASRAARVRRRARQILGPKSPPVIRDSLETYRAYRLDPADDEPRHISYR
jgi:hypothetical protein